MITLAVVEVAFIVLIAAYALISIAPGKGEIFGARVPKRRRYNGPEYQPIERNKAWREPLEFEATKPCPHCGNIDTHKMQEPRKKIDHKDCATVRRCKKCGHMWGEK